MSDVQPDRNQLIQQTITDFQSHHLEKAREDATNLFRQDLEQTEGKMPHAQKIQLLKQDVQALEAGGIYGTTLAQALKAAQDTTQIRLTNYELQGLGFPELALEQMPVRAKSSLTVTDVLQSANVHTQRQIGEHAHWASDADNPTAYPYVLDRGEGQVNFKKPDGTLMPIGDGHYTVKTYQNGDQQFDFDSGGQTSPITHEMVEIKNGPQPKTITMDTWQDKGPKTHYTFYSSGRELCERPDGTGYDRSRTSSGNLTQYWTKQGGQQIYGDLVLTRPDGSQVVLHPDKTIENVPPPPPLPASTS